MTEISHRTVQTNGINMHIAEAGEGPLVLLLHGFPELWYSWRHQLPALAEAGYHAVAPDVRGYGESDKPYEIEAYSMKNHIADALGILDALGEETAVIVGHDWGAPMAWNSAVLHPDRYRAVVGTERAVPPAVADAANADVQVDLPEQLLLHALFPGAGRRRGGVRVGRAQVDADVHVRGVGGRPLRPERRAGPS